MTISQLYKLIEEFKTLSNNLNQIENLKLQSYFLGKQLFAYDIAENMSAIDINQFQNMVLKLDPQSTGVISRLVISSYLTLMNTPIPDSESLETYERQLLEASQDECISCEHFVKVAAFFDSYQSQ